MMATPTDAHREWHTNSGVPMGLPCPMDACDPELLTPTELYVLTRQRSINEAYERGEAGEATVRCGTCKGIHLSTANVRHCALGEPLELTPVEDEDPRIAEIEWERSYG